MSHPQYLISEELAELCRTSTKTVEYWRHNGKGPKWFRVGTRCLYKYEDVMSWLESARQGVA